jgi:Domain of unknown function (DUF3854)
MQAQSYRSKAEHTTSHLTAEHRRQLMEGSGIGPAVIAERSVRTVRSGRGELPSVYSWRQKKRAPGILFTAHRPNGQTSTIFRPDEPDPKNPGCKYEQPCKHLGGSGNVLDVHPSARHLVDDTSVPAFWTEGVKKGDSVTSAARREGTDILAVSISGVWNYLSAGEPIPDFYDIPVDGRQVYIGFDSDMFRKPEVMMAAERLAALLQSRGAEVWIIPLPDQPDGSKTGPDDFLASGRTLEDMLARARPYSPEDLQQEKLSRNEKLRQVLATFTRRESEMPTKTRRDCSKRAAWRACVTLAQKQGKLAADGVEVIVPSMTGAELAAMSQPTFSKCLTDLVEDGYLRRIKRERSEDADRYVLLVPGGVIRYNDGGRRTEQQDQQGHEEDEPHRGYNVTPPVIEMRWSSPGRKGKRGVVKDTRHVRQGRNLAEDTPSVRRPGKKRQEIIRYLVGNGGSATREELLEAFGGPKTTWKNFKKYALADLLGRRRRHKGQDLAVGPPIIELTDVGICLASGWEEALEQHRELGGEIDHTDPVTGELMAGADTRQKIAHLRQRAAYRQRNRTKADRAPTEAEMAEGSEERQQRRRVAQLVREGMSRSFAVKEVLAADGFTCELQPVGDPDRSPDDWEVHSRACECLDCSVRMARYARAFGGVV